MNYGNYLSIHEKGSRLRVRSETCGAQIGAEDASTHPRPTRAPAPSRLSGKAGLVAQVLLLDAKRAWRINDLAEQTAVSSGLVHRVLARLEVEGIVSTNGAGPHRTRHVTDPAALLDLWAEENVDKPVRTRGYLLAQTPQHVVNQLGEGLNDAPHCLCADRRRRRQHHRALRNHNHRHRSVGCRGKPTPKSSSTTRQQPRSPRATTSRSCKPVPTRRSLFANNLAVCGSSTSSGSTPTSEVTNAAGSSKRIIYDERS